MGGEEGYGGESSLMDPLIGEVIRVSYLRLIIKEWGGGGG